MQLLPTGLRWLRGMEELREAVQKLYEGRPDPPPTCCRKFPT
jgi:hypothetical protein